MTGISRPSAVRAYSSLPSICGATAATCGCKPRRGEQLRVDEARVVDGEEQAAEPAGLHHLDVDAFRQHGHVAAAHELLVARLSEQRLADREQHDHHRDAKAVAEQQERRAPRAQHEVAEREELDHRAVLPAIVDDHAVAHVDDAVRGAGEILVVRHDDDRRAVAIHLREQLDHLGAGLRVELARGLVGEQELRRVGQRARDRDALLLAARQLRRPVVVSRGKSDVGQQLARALQALRRAASCASAIGSSTFSIAVSAGIR